MILLKSLYPYFSLTPCFSVGPDQQTNTRTASRLGERVSSLSFANSYDGTCTSDQSNYEWRNSLIPCFIPITIGMDTYDITRINSLTPCFSVGPDEQTNTQTASRVGERVSSFKYANSCDGASVLNQFNREIKSTQTWVTL